MYVPSYYAVTDREEIIAFMKNHPFGLIISSDGAEPVATHIPLEVESRGEDLYLTGHIARVNRQSALLEQEASSVLAVFHGPHTYISSSWYARPDAPTWNYTAVHAYGKLQTITSAQRVEQMIRDLLLKYEGGQEQPVEWGMVPAKMMQAMLKEITCFEIKVERLDAIYKLSQNRTDSDLEAVVTKLDELGWQDREVAEQMRAIRSTKTNRLFTKTSQ
ncbi:FMN-binding negative transcriptional regulator [Brevibacillus reuszeri]|uniref:FMN-binding negative transcriptional regulator n=1 Tax=Brevibacillus reuszeri TaxID=54915 RepID=UPI0028A27AE1|nr:FMN-binding negative transcriptional regulator [Brevibacillus reuszeri]